MPSQLETVHEDCIVDVVVVGEVRGRAEVDYDSDFLVVAVDRRPEAEPDGLAEDEDLVVESLHPGWH